MQPEPVVFKNGHIPALDGFRGLAVLSVMLCHFLLSSELLHGTTVWSRSLQLMHHGVDFFFVLSGFLITGILLDAKGKARYFSTFYWRRTLRIFPLYYLALAITFSIGPALHPQHRMDSPWWFWTYASNIGMLFKGSWLITPKSFDLGHFWSLAVEEQFYLFWPAVVLWLSKERLAQCCLATLAFVPLMQAIIHYFTHNPDLSYAFTLCRVHELGMGAWVAIQVRDEAGRARLARLSKPTCLIMLVLLAIETLQPSLSPRNPLRLLPLSYGRTLILALLATSALSLAIQVGRAPRWQRFLTIPPLLTLGKYSYSLYIFHHLLRPLWEAHVYTFWSLRLGKATWPTGIAYSTSVLLLSLVIAWLTWHFFEAPLLKLKKYFSYDRKAPLPETDREPEKILQLADQ